MESPAPWPLVDSTPLRDCAVFELSRDRARSPRTGRVHAFYRLQAGDWVNVVPVTRSGDVVLVRQYRHGSRRVTWEIPGGQVDPEESPAAAAARELLEETGYGGGDLTFLGVVNPNPALFGNACHTYLAAGVEPRGEVRNEGSEETEVAVVSREDVERLVDTGGIDHALVIAALYWFDRHERRA
jgi:8-oxo-dGTP pyrophosphatase MutT (NUDIX family)